MTTHLTILNDMADADFDRALDIHREWGLHWLDLKSSIYGRSADDMDVDTATRARSAIDAAGLDVYCLSTTLLHDDLARGEGHFRSAHLERIEALAPAIQVLKPRYVRLLAARIGTPASGGFAAVLREHPWVVAVYREAIARITDLGTAATIENEARDCMLATSADMVAFFDALDRSDTVGLTWDIQNQWTCGSFPGFSDYHRLKPLLQYVHVKGGRSADGGSGPVAYKARLEDASWPVVDIVQQVVDDGVSPVICINPSKGKRMSPEDYAYDYDYDDVTRLDIDFLRRRIRGIS